MGMNFGLALPGIICCGSYVSKNIDNILYISKVVPFMFKRLNVVSISYVCGALNIYRGYGTPIAFTAP
jgi:hypothetical protein